MQNFDWLKQASVLVILQQLSSPNDNAENVAITLI